MATAVAQRNSPHMHRPASRTHSPMDNKRSNLVKSEDKKKDSPLKESTIADTLPSQPESAPAVKQPTDAAEKDVKPAVTNAEATQPLAPPPRPSQQNSTDTPDYFSASHGTQYSLEPNLFEQSFGQPSAEIPGKSILPPVASLTSPGNANLGGGFNWSGSLRSGPLSPAMLSGPAGSGDYFDSIRGSFPTPNESSLRTGLTPGGGGSMFPAPSPGSQAFLNSLASGGATPSTLDFHRTAANAAAARKAEQTLNNPTTTQAPATRAQTTAMDPATQQNGQSNFGQHDNDAANGLFMLAQASNETQSNNQFAAANQPAQNSAVDKKRSTRNNAGSIGDSISAGSAREANGESEPEQPKSSTKKSKKSSGKGGKGRKADETPAKQPASKKSKANNGSVHDMSDNDSDEDPNANEDAYHENGKKMTDEEKRKNFLERNRVAALKCRQRKKQWLQNLQHKVEIFSSENDALNAQVSQLREEILKLKTILMAHKDCPLAQQQNPGIANYLHNQSDFTNHSDFNGHPNAYSMAMQPGQQVMAGPRRFS